MGFLDFEGGFAECQVYSSDITWERRARRRPYYGLLRTRTIIKSCRLQREYNHRRNGVCTTFGKRAVACHRNP